MQTLYTILFYLIQPLIWLRLWLRGRKAPAYRLRWRERYGFCKKSVKPNGILVHSVSVGESIAAIPLVRALQRRYPELPITVTTMTPTGSERVVAAYGDSVSHVYLPYDLPGSINRFLNHLQPKLVIIMETELWPNLTNALYKRNIPLIIANARLSARSAKGYGKVASFTRSLLQRITIIAAQNEEDGQRFIQLGLENSHLSITGSIKFDISVSEALKEQSKALQQLWAKERPVWIATSTHEGEDEIILQAHKLLLEQHPDLLLILVPRHLERFSYVAELAKQQFNIKTRSSTEPPSSNTQVMIGDTMGELMLLYGVADIAFIGGSLVERGGHNPLEAAAHHLPLIMGPYTFNFKDICQKLTQSEALITAENSAKISENVHTLLKNNVYRQQLGENAFHVLEKNQGALNRLLTLIDNQLTQGNN